MINLKAFSLILISFISLNSAFVIPIMNCDNSGKNCCCIPKNDISNENCCHNDYSKRNSKHSELCCSISQNESKEPQVFELPLRLDFTFYITPAIFHNLCSILFK